MLSRTADHLYWMARYTERAENIARMLDVNYQMSLLPQGGDVMEQSWIATLSISDLMDAYQKKHDTVTPAKALAFMAFDRDNPSSIYSCLAAARENARAVRGTLTSEAWETLNSTWIDMRKAVTRYSLGAEIADFFEWVKYRSHLARGVIQGTMLRDEAYHFTWLGTYLERADNTARILDVKYHVLRPQGHEETTDFYQWGALLRSVSAFENYRKVYRDVITPERVAELLILHRDLPRSLHFCLNGVVKNLEMVANRHSGETLRQAGILHARLHYARVGDILEQGLHNWLTDFMDSIYQIGDGISRDFLVPSQDSN